MNDIIVEYSGWIRMNPKNIRFEYIGRDDMKSRPHYNTYT